jgi:hypothetical protein
MVDSGLDAPPKRLEQSGGQHRGQPATPAFGRRSRSQHRLQQGGRLRRRPQRARR